MLTLIIFKLIKKLLKYNNNFYIIKLKKDKLQFLDLIYSLKLIEIKILNIYIKINLAINLI